MRSKKPVQKKTLKLDQVVVEPVQPWPGTLSSPNGEHEAAPLRWGHCPTCRGSGMVKAK